MTAVTSRPRSSSRPRRTQAERSEATRARLLDAAIECLDELGYAGTTTTEVARRAGVSRGAQLHQFPTRAELVSSAVDHVFRRREQEFRDALTALPSEDRGVAAVDVLWGMFQGPIYRASLELCTAARTDPELREHLLKVDTRQHEAIAAIFAELFPAPADADDQWTAIPLFLFALLDGLALRRQLVDDPRTEPVLDIVKMLSRLFLTPLEAR